MESYHTFRNRIILLGAGVTSILAVLALGAEQPALVKGMLIGFTTGAINFILLSRDTVKFASRNTRAATAGLLKKSLVRYLVIALGIIAAIKVPGTNMAAFVLGLFMLHIVILLNHALFSKSKETGIQSRSDSL